MVDQGYLANNPGKAKAPMIVMGVLMLVGGIGLLTTGTTWAGLAAGLAVSGIILGIFSKFMPARTAKGVETREYLAGLKYYMKVAEAERLRILQSPHGKLTDKVDTGDGKALVKLYERVLPYAVLFGIEKDWAKEMAPLYEAAGGSPDWYAGNGAFNAVVFANAMSGFSTAGVASFSAPSSSAGGGSAGGGGGGGGGGGW